MTPENSIAIRPEIYLFLVLVKIKKAYVPFNYLKVY